MRIIKLLLLLLLGTPVFAQDVPARPSPPRLVNNFSQQFPGFLSSSEEAALEQKLVKFSNETSNQIVVVIVDDFGGMDANEYAVSIGKKWGVGQKEFDNGVVVLINPSGKAGHREPPYIAVGYGLEGVIPDITAKHICEEEIAPAFSNGNYYEGLNAGTDRIMQLAKGEINSDAYNKQHSGKPTRYLWILAIVIILVIVISRKGGGGRGGFGAGAATGFLIGSSGFGRSGFGGGGFSGGGGGFGGFGGGGFGGGGGGGGKW
ncbi:MAG: TPM domain-containing protein [Bacteroidia bacterium]